MSKLAMQNKAESYESFDARTVVDRIRDALTDCPYMTRRELHEVTGVEIGTLCGAIARMRKQGTLCEAFAAHCDTTGKFVIKYRLVTGALE